MKKTAQVHARIPEPLNARLVALAERTRYTVPTLVQMCLEGYLPALEARLPDMTQMLPPADSGEEGRVVERRRPRAA